MRIHRFSTVIGSAIVISSLITMSGCGIKTAIRAPESMLKENPMTKIAVLSTGKINWPSVRGKFCLQPSGSLAATEAFTQLTKEELTTMGYDVVMAETVGVGFQCRNWVVMPEKQANSEAKPENYRVVTNDNPLMICPKFQDEEPLSKAAVKVNDDFERIVLAGQSDQFEPDKNMVAAIGEATGADTICLVRVTGAKYTGGRKFAAALLGGSANDASAAYFSFIEAKTGTVLWQSFYFSFSDPTMPTANALAAAFKYLPHSGQPFDNTLCSTGGKQGFIYCK
jgi:hypothetical protein